MSSVHYAVIDTPLDRLGVAWSAAGLRRIWFYGADTSSPVPVEWHRLAEPAFGAGEQLAAYFSGERVDFDLPLDARGTPFQQRVWQALTEIPYGRTRTYGEIARRLGRPRAARAVGGANHRNPLPVVVPCHRVIGAGGALTGYAGGLRIKRFLLDLEAGSSSRAAA